MEDINPQARGWTPERKVKQAQAIRQWAPWLNATGPRTKQGKSVTRMNAFKDGESAYLRELTKQLNQYNTTVGQLGK